MSVFWLPHKVFTPEWNVALSFCSFKGLFS